MGGLSKKAYQIRILADKNVSPPLLLDAGNLLFKQLTVAHSQELLTAAGLMEIYQQMAYDAVAVGQHDLAAGIEFLKNSQGKDFPWLSANLMDMHNNLIFPAVKIIERGAMKIGIIGLTGRIAPLSPEIIVADWRKVLPEHLARLNKECRLVIVLSSLSGEDNGELTRQFPQVQVLITADRQQGNITPRVDNDTIVTQTANQGKFLGMLNLNGISDSSWGTGREKAAETTTGIEPPHLTGSDFIALSKNLPEDPQIAAGIEAIKAKISEHNQKPATPGKEQQDSADNPLFSDLAGSARCRECHPLQTQFWNSTRHAGAYATLQRQQQNYNLDCLPCHITKNPVPDQAATLPVASLSALPPPALQSVGCEACHGPGLAHADTPDKVKPHRKVEENTCVACHSKERDSTFDYQQKLPKVSCPKG